MADHMSSALHPNVRMRETLDGNEYLGTAEDLIASRLIQEHQLPEKSRASFSPDGTRVKQGDNSTCKLEGYKKVLRVGKKFRVIVRQADSVQEHRHEVWCARLQAEMRLGTADHQKAYYPRPTGNPMDRMGRLHAGCILDYGARSLLGDGFENVCAMSPAERWKRIPAEGDDTFSPNTIEAIRRTMSEIEAWQEIQRIRYASRT